MSRTLHFKTNALLKNLVGKDLINDDNLAIIELIKNSYDAKARLASIAFLGEDNIYSIVVLDDGSGMSLRDIEDKWLNIAYSEKKAAKTASGAYFAGNKGIGRFSCDRLGRKLCLITRKVGGPILRVDIDWQMFEINESSEKLIQSVPLRQSEISGREASSLIGNVRFPKSGTALVIEDLRSDWPKTKLRGVKTSLERFLSPNQSFMDAPFRLEMRVQRTLAEDENKEYKDRLNGEIENQIFQKLEFNATYIASDISADGETVSTKLFHEGRTVYELSEKNDLYPHLRDVRAVVYFLNPYKKAYFKRQTGLRSVDFGSVFLFLNGFRVQPYGEAGDDWLGLELRKGQGHSRFLGGRDVVGRIEISGSESSDGEDTFKTVSSREGLKETPAFVELKRIFFLNVFKRLERFVVDGLDWDSVPATLRDTLRQEDGLDWRESTERYQESWDKKRQRIGLSILPLIGTTSNRLKSLWFDPALLDEVHTSRQAELERLVGSIESFEHSQIDGSLRTDLASLARAFRNKATEATEAKREASKLRATVEKQGQRIKQLSTESQTYRAQTLFVQSVATHGVKELLAFHHQICLDTAIIDNLLGKLMRLTRERAPVEKLVAEIEKLTKANRRIASIAQFASKANFKAGTKKEATDIAAFFEQYLTSVATDFVATGMRLRVINRVPAPFECRCSRIELSMLIDNLLSNSGKAEAKAVTVSLDLIAENLLRISFTDDGTGLDPQFSDPAAIFELGVTTSNGSGIGLYHVAEVVKSMDGAIVATPRSDGQSGLTITIELPR